MCVCVGGGGGGGGKVRGRQTFVWGPRGIAIIPPSHLLYTIKSQMGGGGGGAWCECGRAWPPGSPPELRHWSYLL